MSLLEGIIDKKHILLVGAPRSASTWLGKILSTTIDYSYVHEPDDEKHNFFGYYAKQGLPRIPIISAEDENKRLHELFQMAFYQPYITSTSYSNQLLNKIVKLKPELVENQLTTNGHNPTKNLKVPYVIAHLFPKQLGNRNNRVVKTVLGTYITDYLLYNFPDLQPVFTIRHPAAVTASLLRIDSQDIDRKLYHSPGILERHPELKTIKFENQTKEFLGGLQTALLYNEVSRLVKKYPKSIVVKFEDLVEDPFLYSYNLYKKLEMKWKDDVELFIANSNRKATASETREFSKAQAFKWKTELNESQIDQIRFGFRLIKGVDYYQDF